MRYLEIKKHINDKNNYWYYGIIILMIMIFMILINFDIENYRFSRFTALDIAAPFLLIFSIRTILINSNRSRFFFQSFKNEINNGTAKLSKIVIGVKSYKMRVPKNTYVSEIQPMPKSTNAICIETSEYLLLFFSITYLGIFQEVLKPFVLVKTDNSSFDRDKNVVVIKDFEIIETAQNRTINFPNDSYQVTKAILPKQNDT